MRKNSILIIGGSGFIGRHLAESLLQIGFLRVTILDISKPMWLNHKVKFIEGSFENEHILDEALKSSAIVYHLASTTLPKTSNENPIFDVSTNLVGTIRLLELCVKHRIEKFIFTSSGGTVYGITKSFPIAENFETNPICSHGIVKLTIEKYLRLFNTLYGLNSCSFRIANPFGEYQRFDRPHGAVTVFCSKAIKNEDIEIWGDGSTSRDFIYIKDVIGALISALNSKIEYEEINIGSGVAISLNELVKIIEHVSGRKLSIKYRINRPFDVPVSYLDISKAKQFLNWQPSTSLEQGIINTYNWIKSQSS